MPVLPFLPMIIGGVSSLVGSKLSPNKSTSTTQQTRDPAGEAMRAQLAEILKTALSAGASIPSWQKNAGAAQVNRGYTAALPKLEAEYAKRGFETSGKMGGAIRGLEVGRINALSTSQNQLASAAQQRYDEMLKLAEQFTNPTGSTTTSTGPSGTGNAVAGIGGDLSTMLLLRSLFAQGGGGSSSGGGFEGFTGQV